MPDGRPTKRTDPPHAFLCHKLRSQLCGRRQWSYNHLPYSPVRIKLQRIIFYCDVMHVATLLWKLSRRTLLGKALNLATSFSGATAAIALEIEPKVFGKESIDSSCDWNKSLAICCSIGSEWKWNWSHYAVSGWDQAMTKWHLLWRSSPASSGQQLLFFCSRQNTFFSLVRWTFEGRVVFWDTVESSVGQTLRETHLAHQHEVRNFDWKLVVHHGWLRAWWRQ